MELREFAQQVLFATTLEEKLRCPAGITDDEPGRALATPAAPGRPAALRFKPQGGGKGEFPGTHRLEDEHERGRLLHFFANHELLATELMALVLVRFPEAPAAFRRGVLQTLKDEQKHTRLYVERMKACGVEFGELPVSGYFWRAISALESPMDFVAGLSLTFEQANLDFAQHFARGFATVGDADSARLLERIYRDEIAHVAHGLKWFRRWKNPLVSDWEAFCSQLKFPLSPSRAKGATLNVEGRRAAGLDVAFIDALNVHSQSKGRTPGVFVFNPFAEGFIAQGAGFTPVKHQAELARDLATLPQYLCRQDDIVIVQERPAVSFLSGIKQAGFALPEFVEWKSIAMLAERKLGRLRPWAWGPDSVALLAPLFANVTGEQRAASECFNEGTARLYSKAWSAELLREVLSRQENGAWLCALDDVGVAVDSTEAVLEAIAAIRRRGQHKVVVKEALGLAGHNAIRLWEPELLATQRRWIENATQNGRQLVVEPWLERAVDFSVQLEMTSTGLKLCGYTGLLNDGRGQFHGNWAAPHHERRPPAQVTALFPSLPDIASRVQRLYTDVFALLEKKLRAVAYLGPVGIDAFVHRAPAGDHRLKPIVEINPRHTMGRLTLELMKQTAPGSFGLFHLVNRSQARKAGAADFIAYAMALSERAPLLFAGEPVAKIREGALCLNDPAQAQACLAIFEGAASAEWRSASRGTPGVIVSV